ncbi:MULTISPECIES: hypothetical protein [unclassified Granulicatella]|uniref:hypothetical protein n=1 Tax=unclassified Granulicatella TaxID=2630493 RepID=UPI0025563A8F|nr:MULTISPECIES: hypothetical protein [unclassified Granulicatella]MDK8380923.1 hypothetical protein [Granulicatella sp. UMB5615B]MDK8522005.1 hypothetical protein [Granulicatella sp. UMB5615A]
MKKKKRIEEIQLARLRELLMAAIRERSGEVVALPSASVVPFALKKIFKIFFLIFTVYLFLFSLLGFDSWFQALVTHPFNFLKDQIEFNPFFRVYLFVLMIVFGLFLWERKAFKEEQAQIIRRAKEEVLEWQNFTDEELPSSVKELKQYLAGNDDAFNIEEPREPVIKSLLRLFHRNVSKEDITELRQQLVTILSQQQQDASKLPKGVPYLLISIMRIVLLSVCSVVTLYIIRLFITSYYDAIIALIFFGIPICMLWMFYFEISSSVHERRKIDFDKLFEIARAEIATYKDVAVEDVPEQIKQLQRFIEVLESKYHISGENAEWKKIER